MSKVVLKWPIVMNSEPQMIGGGKVVHVDVQNSIITLWTEEAPSVAGIEVPKSREVLVVGTGHAIPSSHPHHLGSVMMLNGAYVWHIYGNVSREGLYV